MARNAAEKKNRQVNATIPAELFDALDEHRWSARIDGMTQLTRVALEEYAVNHDVKVAAADEDTAPEAPKPGK